jgi:hypothetical protein
MNGFQTGNKSVTNGPCLTINEIPEFNYYPKVFTIEVYSDNLGPQSKMKRSILILDCNDDDPTCQDFYGLMPNGTTSVSGLNDGDSLMKNVDYIKVYSLEGKELFKTNNFHNFNVLDIPYKGLILISYFDKKGNIITSKKFFNQ